MPCAEIGQRLSRISSAMAQSSSSCRFLSCGRVVLVGMPREVSQHAVVAPKSPAAPPVQSRACTASTSSD
eukprot:4661476-Alexandrium_andersonii.AAC.1